MHPLVIKEQPLCDYLSAWHAMQAFTAKRDNTTPDELWLLQHPPVFTQGLAGKKEHVLDSGDIPVIQTDRGGQVTYHGPGQLVAYVLFDLNRLNIGIRQLVSQLENSVIALLDQYGITAQNRCDAPGVYIKESKICSIGLRVRKGFSYHGIALNVNMDLSPFERINPCGWRGLTMTQLSAFVPEVTVETVADQFRQQIQRIFAFYEMTP